MTPDWYLATGAGRFGIGPGEAAEIVAGVERRYLGDHPKAAERQRFLRQLHLDDLMLARACARGHEPAWEELWRRYRQRLHAAARGITRDAERGAELADSLFADLYGLRERNGERVSKLDSYTGIGSLEGWLCALLAQAHVDQWRRERRLVDLDENEQLLRVLAAPSPTGAGAETANAVPARQVETALETVLSGLKPAAQLLLKLYFLDSQTLAQIGTLLGVHESTVSRRLERLLTQLRHQTRRELARSGFSPRASQEAMRLDPRWLQVDVRKLLQPVTIGRNPGGPPSV